ncbi:MAG: gamma-glutamylcyclotransferase family protein, partial [Pseudomonadota bacterium]
MADRVLRASLVLTKPVFLYGTLLDPELYDIVSGALLEAQPAQLQGAAVFWVAGESFPILVAAPDAAADGVLVHPSAGARARLDYYELGFGYTVETRQVQGMGGPVEADVYVPEGAWPQGALWSLGDWQSRHGALTRVAAREYMGLMITHSPQEAARAFPQIRMRADSRLRAQAAPSPAPLSPDLSGRAVVPDRTEQPYTDYFA